MSSAWRPRNDYVPPELAELRRQVDSLSASSRQNLLPLCERLTAIARRQDRTQEALDQFQLDIKCLHFDLDATRRERHAFRQRIQA